MCYTKLPNCKLTGSILIAFILHCLFVSNSYSQEFIEKSNRDNYWFISLNSGSQMSGIKREDFVLSNYSPLVKVSAGKWFSKELALRLGYQGFYYHLITDNKKHPYNFFFGETIFDVLNLFSRDISEQKWRFSVNCGAGYFINNSLGQPDIIAATFGVSTNFHLTQRVSFNLELSSIMGWDIYQGDEDILPGISLGMRYEFE